MISSSGWSVPVCVPSWDCGNAIRLSCIGQVKRAESEFELSFNLHCALLPDLGRLFFVMIAITSKGHFCNFLTCLCVSDLMPSTFGVVQTCNLSICPRYLSVLFLTGKRVCMKYGTWSMSYVPGILDLRSKMCRTRTADCHPPSSNLPSLDLCCL